MRAFFHADQQLHDPKQFMRLGVIGEPKDLPIRTERLLAGLQASGIAVEHPKPEDLDSAIADVHDPGYVRFLRSAYARWHAMPGAGPEVLPNLSPYWNGRPGSKARPPCRSHAVVAEAGHYLGDLAVPIGPQSWASVLASAASATSACDAILSGGRAAYALCRPSGHHARSDRASGFCYLNNAAIAAQRLRSRFAKVAIIDVDAHHGDGTQEIFYARADVLTVSIHADPSDYYPFYTGYPDERGVGEGEGFNLNLPLSPGLDEDAYTASLDKAMLAAGAFAPGALVIALGFDAHRDDPIGVLKLSTSAFRSIGEALAGLDVPSVVVQEGGYAIPVLGDCLAQFIGGFAS